MDFSEMFGGLMEALRLGDHESARTDLPTQVEGVGTEVVRGAQQEGTQSNPAATWRPSVLATQSFMRGWAPLIWRGNLGGGIPFPMFTGFSNPIHTPSPQLEAKLYQSVPTSNRVQLAKVAEQFQAEFARSLVVPGGDSDLPGMLGLTFDTTVIFFSPEKLAMVYQILLCMKLAGASGMKANLEAGSKAIAALVPEKTALTVEELKQLLAGLVNSKDLPSFDDVKEVAEGKIVSSREVINASADRIAVDREAALKTQKVKALLGELDLKGIMDTALSKAQVEMDAYNRDFPVAMAWIREMSELSGDSSIREKYLTGDDAQIRSNLTSLTEYLAAEKKASEEIGMAFLHKIAGTEQAVEEIQTAYNVLFIVSADHGLSNHKFLDGMDEEVKATGRKFPTATRKILEDMYEACVADNKSNGTAFLQGILDAYVDSATGRFKEDVVGKLDGKMLMERIREHTEMNPFLPDELVQYPIEEDEIFEEMFSAREELAAMVADSGLDLTILTSNDGEVIEPLRDFPYGANAIFNQLLQWETMTGRPATDTWSVYFDLNGSIKLDVLEMENEAAIRLLGLEAELATSETESEYEYDEEISSTVSVQIDAGAVYELDRDVAELIHHDDILGMLDAKESHVWMRSHELMQAAVDYPWAIIDKLEAVLECDEASRKAKFIEEFQLETSDKLTELFINRGNLAAMQCGDESGDFLVDRGGALVPPTAIAITHRAAVEFDKRGVAFSQFFFSDGFWKLWQDCPYGMAYLLENFLISPNLEEEHQAWFGDIAKGEELIRKMNANLEKRLGSAQLALKILPTEEVRQSPVERIWYEMKPEPTWVKLPSSPLKEAKVTMPTRVTDDRLQAHIDGIAAQVDLLKQQTASSRVRSRTVAPLEKRVQAHVDGIVAASANLKREAKRKTVAPAVPAPLPVDASTKTKPLDVVIRLRGPLEGGVQGSTPARSKPSGIPVRNKSVTITGPRTKPDVTGSRIPQLAPTTTLKSALNPTPLGSPRVKSPISTPKPKGKGSAVPKRTMRKGTSADLLGTKGADVQVKGSWESFKERFVIVQDGDSCVVRVCKVFALALCLIAFPLTLTVRALLYFYDSCCAERVNPQTGATVTEKYAAKA